MSHKSLALHYASSSRSASFRLSPCLNTKVAKSCDWMTSLFKMSCNRLLYLGCCCRKMIMFNNFQCPHSHVADHVTTPFFPISYQVKAVESLGNPQSVVHLIHSISKLVKQAVKFYLYHNHCDNTQQMPEFL